MLDFSVGVHVSQWSILFLQIDLIYELLCLQKGVDVICNYSVRDDYTLCVLHMNKLYPDDAHCICVPIQISFGCVLIQISFGCLALRWRTFVI